MASKNDVWCSGNQNCLCWKNTSQSLSSLATELRESRNKVQCQRYKWWWPCGKFCGNRAGNSLMFTITPVQMTNYLVVAVQHCWEGYCWSSYEVFTRFNKILLLLQDSVSKWQKWSGKGWIQNKNVFASSFYWVLSTSLGAKGIQKRSCFTHKCKSFVLGTN